MCRCSTLKIFCQKGWCLHMPFPHSSPQHSLTCIPPNSRRAKQTKKSMVKQQETNIVCVPIQTEDSTGTEEKHWATWRQKASWAPGASFHAHTWSPEQENQHLCTGSKFHSCTTPSTKASCTKAGTQSIIFLSLSQGRGRTWSPSTSSYYSFFLCLVWFAHLGTLTSLKNKAKMALSS